MFAEKKFFRVRLSAASQFEAKMVNGLTLTKRWQVKTGDIENFAKFPDVEAQAVEKRGNDFAPVENADGETKTGGENNPDPAAAALTDAGEDDAMRKFNEMTEEQLKAFLAAKSVPQNELKSKTKKELVARAESLRPQEK